MHLKVDGDDKSYSKQDSCSNYFEESSITNKHRRHVTAMGHTFVHSLTAAYYYLQ